jgi:hypothetical protein
VRSGRLVFEERFHQPAGSPPNPHHWVAEIGGGGWGCGQKQVYTASTDNAAVDDQQRLAITARCDNTGEITSARLTKGPGDDEIRARRSPNPRARKCWNLVRVLDARH